MLDIAGTAGMMVLIPANPGASPSETSGPEGMNGGAENAAPRGIRRSAPPPHETPNRKRHTMTGPQFPLPGFVHPGQPQQFAPQYSQPAYAPPQQYGYAPAPVEPQFTPAGGTLDDFLNQRTAGTPYWKFPQPGAVNVGMVARELRDSDVAQRTFKGQPIRRQDGSINQEKALTIPLINQDGSEALWEVHGKNRDLLTAAVQATGVPNGIPEAGGVLQVTFVRKESVPGTSATRHVLDVQYVRPQGAPAPQAAAPAPEAPAPAPAPQPVKVAEFPQQVAVAQPGSGQFVPQSAPQVQQAAPAPQPVAAPQDPAGLSPDAAAQFSAMLGAAQPQQ